MPFYPTDRSIYIRFLLFYGTFSTQHYLRKRLIEAQLVLDDQNSFFSRSRRTAANTCASSWTRLCLYSRNKLNVSKMIKFNTEQKTQQVRLTLTKQMKRKGRTEKLQERSWDKNFFTSSLQCSAALPLDLLLITLGILLWSKSETEHSAMTTIFFVWMNFIFENVLRFHCLVLSSWLTSHQ